MSNPRSPLQIFYLKTKMPSGGNKLLSQLVQFVNVNCHTQAYNYVSIKIYLYLNAITKLYACFWTEYILMMGQKPYGSYPSL